MSWRVFDWLFVTVFDSNFVQLIDWASVFLKYWLFDWGFSFVTD